MTEQRIRTAITLLIFFAALFLQFEGYSWAMAFAAGWFAGMIIWPK